MESKPVMLFSNKSSWKGPRCLYLQATCLNKCSILHYCGITFSQMNTVYHWVMEVKHSTTISEKLLTKTYDLIGFSSNVNVFEMKHGWTVCGPLTKSTTKANSVEFRFKMTHEECLVVDVASIEIPSQKLTWNLKMPPWKRFKKTIYKPPFLGFPS